MTTGLSAMFKLLSQYNMYNKQTQTKEAEIVVIWEAVNGQGVGL